MRKITTRHLCMLALSLVGAAFITGCSTTNVPYRTYYQDRHCRVFYVDVYGNRVYEWKSSAMNLNQGQMTCRDSHGRLYYEDSFGNRIYHERMCNKCK